MVRRGRRRRPGRRDDVEFRHVKFTHACLLKGRRMMMICTEACDGPHNGFSILVHRDKKAVKATAPGMPPHMRGSRMSRAVVRRCLFQNMWNQHQVHDFYIYIYIYMDIDRSMSRGITHWINLYRYVWSIQIF